MTAVFEVLSSSQACLLRQTQLDNTLRLAVWQNADDRTAYHAPEHHTVSLYLDGGYQTFRRDQPGHYGAPGRVCILPAGHDSEWVVDGHLRFLHLYFGRESVRELFEQALGTRARHLSLHEQTYIEDPQLAQLCQQWLLPLDWHSEFDRLSLQHAAQLVLLHLLRREQQQPRAVSVGLAPTVRKRVLEYIAGQLQERLSLEQLADIAGLSPYHFSRMFRHSLGVTVHRYVQQQRLEQARQWLLAEQSSLAEIAARCGFASQSHFGHCFRQQYGVSPKRYREQTP